MYPLAEREAVGRAGGLVSGGYRLGSDIVSQVDSHILVFSEKQNSEKY